MKIFSRLVPFSLQPNLLPKALFFLGLTLSMVARASVDFTPPAGWHADQHSMGADLVCFPLLKSKERMTTLLFFHYPLTNKSPGQISQILDSELAKVSAQDPHYKLIKRGAFNLKNAKGEFAHFKQKDEETLFEHFALVIPNKGQYEFVYFSSPPDLYEEYFNEIEGKLKASSVSPNPSH